MHNKLHSATERGEIMVAIGAEFDCKKMRKTELDVLCRYLIPKIEKFFEDPKNLADFEEWQRKRKEKTGAA